MLYVGQPVTANCREEYLCIVETPRMGNCATVNVIAIIERGDHLNILEVPFKQDWFVNVDEPAILRAEVLYADYSRLTGTETALAYSKEEIETYSIKGRMI